MMRILKKRDLLDGVVYACPYCHRYITRAFGIKKCYGCGGNVDNEHVTQYDGRVIFDGMVSWKDD